MTKTYDPRNPWIWRENFDKFAGKLMLFAIYPFFAWVICLFDANKKSSFVIFFLFDLLLLWHMSPNNLSGYHDFLGIMERFQDTNLSTSELMEECYNYFTFSIDAPKELYQDFLCWFTKLFTKDNYHLHFLFASIPVALCQLNVLRRITSDRRASMSFYLLMVIILMIIPRDIIGVQNPRFTTGFWVCAMAAIAYYTDYGKPLSAALIIISPVFHSAMFPFVLIFLLSFLLRQRKILEALVWISLPFTFIDADLFRNLSFDFLPASLSFWAAAYVSDETYIELIYKERAGFWWVDSFFTIGQKIVYIYMSIMLIRKKDIVLSNYESCKFYDFYLLLFSFVNFIQFVPELGNRYYGFEKVFCMYIWFKAFFPHYKKVTLILFFLSCFYMLNRYGYVFGGALSVNTPPDIFFMPLPYLIGKGILW